ncbi:F-box only protein 27-like isoform X2 [Heteronotia binoei]|uniref:F-box only protein 27-like isoform X2 n=1 Tax=Heteronotia binoei TaxID=13085 RepID=UPI00292D1A8E|nr:F-box only protein 27-like isoform X2 [Heteronotia binoei]
MGQAKSWRRADVAPQSSQGAPSQMDVTLLPQELLVLILSWVPSWTLVTVGRLVCRQWKDLIDGPVLWKLQGERDPSKREAFCAALEAARHCPRMEWARVGVLQPFGRNLIKNPRGKDQFQHWQVSHRDDICTDGIICQKSQLVDLVKEGLWEDLLDSFQPDIFISDCQPLHPDLNCSPDPRSGHPHEPWSCTNTLVIVLLAADKNSVITSIFIPEWNVPFQQASHVFRKYGPGVRFLQFMHIGNCTGAEHTAHITDSTVLVKLSR